MAKGNGRVRSPRVVAVVGARSALGKGLAARLEGEPWVERIVTLDLRPQSHPSPKSVFHPVDLTHPNAEPLLAGIFQREKVDTVVHLALLGTPLTNATYAHELDVVGTKRVLAASLSAKVRQLVFRSTTAVYGPDPRQPALLSEAAPFRGHPPAYIENKRAAEAAVVECSEASPHTKVAILRFAPEWGPSTGNLFQRYLQGPIAPVIMGRDPLVQVIHEEDAIEALLVVVKKRGKGIFNVAPPGPVPLLGALRIRGVRPIPLPHPVAAAALLGLRALGIAPAFSDAYLDFLCFPFVADGSHFQKKMGFQFRYDVKEALRQGRESDG